MIHMACEAAQFTVCQQKLDLSIVSPEELNFEAPFALTMQHDTKCHVWLPNFKTKADTNLVTKFSCTGSGGVL